jgi:hypothetical protein
METYYYSTQPFIAWVINKYFYKEHYTYVAPFYPYRLPNPKSSNPYLIYGDLYLPWKDNDIYDKTIAQFRLNIRKGVMIKETNGDLQSQRASELKELCDKISLKFFYPIVYRVNIDQVQTKLKKAGSGLTGSKEFLIPNLNDNEFDILFFDEWPDHPTIGEIFENKNALDDTEILEILRGNYVDTI